jgi:hypothetical protein
MLKPITGRMMAWRRVGALVTILIGLVVMVAGSAQAAQQYHVSADKAPAGDHDGGVYLFNRPGYYYMGRLYLNQTFDRTGTAVYPSGVYPRRTQPYLYRFGRAHGSVVSCLWIGPSASGPSGEYLANDNTSVDSQCSSSGSKSVVGSTEWLKNRNNIGKLFNCPDHRARGPQNTTVAASTDLYTTVHWNSTYSGGTLGGHRLHLTRGAPVQYRYTTKDGTLAAVFAPGFGWGFVAANKIVPVSGRWSFAGSTSTAYACGENLSTSASASDVDEGPLPVVEGRPHAISWGSGRIDVFARGTDDDLWHRSYDGVWQPWEDLGGGLTGDPVPVSWGAGRIDVFARGVDDDLQHIAYSGGAWGDWESLGGVMTSDPSPITWGSGHLDVFIRSTDAALHHNWLGSSGWSGWSSLGGSFNGNPAAISWGYGRIDVFTRGGSGDLQHTWYDPAIPAGWGGWESLGGTIVSDPAPESWGSGHLDVFARGTDAQLYHRYYANGWSPWTQQGGMAINGNPNPLSWGYGRIDVFARGLSNDLKHTFFDTVIPGWAGWESLGGNIASDPSTITFGSGHLDVFSRGSDAQLYHNWYGSSGWSGWTSLGSPLTG